MNLKEKGWLKKYLEKRKCLASPEQFQTFFKDLSTIEDKTLHIYKLLQPTGLIYGYPVQAPVIEIPDFQKYDEIDKQKLIFVESLFSASLITQPNLDINSFDRLLPVEEIVEQINGFYTDIFPESIEESKSFFGKIKTGADLMEYFVERQISIKGNVNNFWISLFQNTLLFLDIILFVQWFKGKDEALKKEIINQREETYTNILKVIGLASSTDNEITVEERNLFDFFLMSTKLKDEKVKEIRQSLTSNLTLDDVKVGELKSWLLRKYILELAILTTWADKEVTDSERTFLIKLNEKLNFNSDELEGSMLAVESFVVANWEQVHYLKHKSNYHHLTDRLVKRLSGMISKNQNRIATEVKQSKELVILLNKSITTELTEEERIKVRIQLLDILKVIPTFVLLVLPGSFITLPILLKILPKSVLFPSSFQD
jgi:hypothetical protein